MITITKHTLWGADCKNDTHTLIYWKNDNINWKLTLTVITISGFNCIEILFNIYNINWKLTFTVITISGFNCIKTLFNIDNINRKITLTVITKSGIHCIKKLSFFFCLTISLCVCTHIGSYKCCYFVKSTPVS